MRTIEILRNSHMEKRRQVKNLSSGIFLFLGHEKTRGRFNFPGFYSFGLCQALFVNPFIPPLEFQDQSRDSGFLSALISQSAFPRPEFPPAGL